MRRRLLVAAPAGFAQAVSDALRHAAEIVFVERPSASGDRRDPYGLSNLIATQPRACDALLLVAPRRRSPRLLAPAPVIHGVPVGIVQADAADDLLPWIAALRHQRRGTLSWATMAMGLDVYLGLGARLNERMATGAAGGPLLIEDWGADRLDRGALCRMLAKGPRLAVYVGHGRAAGWSGYQALRWRHVAAETLGAPAGVVVGFTCDTLRYHRDRAPFGCRWVRDGRAAAYFGSTVAVCTKGGADLAELFVATAASGRHEDLAGVLRAVNARLDGDPALAGAKRAFDGFRLVGDPLAVLGTVH